MTQITVDRVVIEQAAKALGGMLTHMGMDEDHWNKPTFDQARASAATLRAALEAKPDHAEQHLDMVPVVSCMHSSYSIDTIDGQGQCCDCGASGRVKFVADERSIGPLAAPVQRQPITKEDIRAAGGIVHSDGNVFFTSIEQINNITGAA